MRKQLCFFLLLLSFGATRAEEPKAGIQTLEATNIEGEIRLPQVLFITSRDSERPLDYLDWYAAMTSLEIGKESPMPNRIHVVQLERLEGEDAPADSEGSVTNTESTPKEESP